MKPIRTIWKVCKKIISEVSFSFLMSTRSGMALLHVSIAGSGSLPSTLILGGGPDAAIPGLLANRPGFRDITTGGANWCCLRAYDSLLFGRGRIGSIGKNLKLTSYFVHLTARLKNTKDAYIPKVLLVKCSSLYSSFDKVANLCLSRKASQ